MKCQYLTHHEVKKIQHRGQCPTGKKIEMRHRPYMHEDGRRELKWDKPVPIFDQIQQYKEECEIENIIRRAVEGDYNALNQSKGQYMDITSCPQSLAQAQQMIIELKTKFDDLPKEIKAKFDYNAEIYIAEFGSEEWAEKTGVKEALKKQAEAQAKVDQINENTVKAIENLAQGNTIVQKGEVNNES